jgi:hypothetical protein
MLRIHATPVHAEMVNFVSRQDAAMMCELDRNTMGEDTAAV